MKKIHLKGLLQIPWFGPIMAEDFWELGYREVSDFKDANPEQIFQKFYTFYQIKPHRCVLYIIRCAVYFASNSQHDPVLLKWWNWKDSQKDLIR